MKRDTSKTAKRSVPAQQNDVIEEERDALFAVVDETIDSLGDWLHEDITFHGADRHDFRRGSYLSEHLVTLVAMLIKAEIAAGEKGDL